MNALKIGEIIKELRGTKGVSQETLAAVCDVSMQAVSKWENGQSCPDIAFLPLLAEYFQVSIDYLLTGKESAQKCGTAQDSELLDHLKAITEEDTLYIIQYRNGQILDKKKWEQDQLTRLHQSEAIRIAFEDDFESLKNGLHIEIWGNADIESKNIHMNLCAGGNVKCDAVDGNIASEGNVECGSVNGNIASEGNVECGSVNGNASSGGSITCGNIDGNAAAGGEITCNDIGGDAEAGYLVSCKSINGSAKALHIQYKD